LPTIKTLEFYMTLPAGVEDAGSFVRTGLSSLVSHIRGLQRVYLRVQDTDDHQHDSIRASLPNGANVDDFTIRHLHCRHSTAMEASRSA